MCGVAMHWKKVSVTLCLFAIRQAFISQLLVSCGRCAHVTNSSPDNAHSGDASFRNAPFFTRYECGIAHARGLRGVPVDEGEDPVHAVQSIGNRAKR